jgi:hypothetical protein
MCKALCSIPTTTKTKTEQNTHKARSQCKTGSRLEGGCDELGEHIVSLRGSHNSAPASFNVIYGTLWPKLMCSVTPSNFLEVGEDERERRWDSCSRKGDVCKPTSGAIHSKTLTFSPSLM